MLRDKTYVRLDNGMLFNVTGYEHPPGRVFASLKYINGELGEPPKKWTSGYEAAKKWLAVEEPDFVDGFISIPIDRIADVYHPQVRWAKLSRSEQVAPLHSEALELGNAVRKILQIPDSTLTDHDTEFGITDSLLWGDGAPTSDIDLVVVGRENGQRLQTRAELLYAHSDFKRPDPREMKAPYGLSVDDWPQIIARKLHMGSFRDRPFSVRVVLRGDELETRSVFEETVSEKEEIQFRICDRSDSLLFPAVYLNDEGDELVDYSVVYEGVFRVGDVVCGECSRVNRVFNANDSRSVRRRFVLHSVTRWTTSCH